MKQNEIVSVPKSHAMATYKDMDPILADSKPSHRMKSNCEIQASSLLQPWNIQP
jgi:hypothetical protein